MEFPVEVLFEYKESKRKLGVTPRSVCAILTQELARFGKEGAVVQLAKPQSSRVTVQPAGVYLLQKWSTTWQTYIDVESTAEIVNKDRLTVVPMPGSSPAKPKSAVEKAQGIIGRVKKPTEAQAKALATYFPSTSSRKRRMDPFDPSAECVVISQQRKKKAAIKGKPKIHSVTVILMPAFQSSVPKGKKRQTLLSEGRIQTLRLTRCMSALEVKNAIIRAFSSKSISSFVVLACDVSGHNLSRASEQSIDGEMTAQRRGCLYLCEESKVVISSDDQSDDDFVKPPSTAAGRMRKRSEKLLEALEKPPALQHDSDSSGEGLDVGVEASEHNREYLLESRRLREEQNLAYAESLRIDQAKAEKARSDEANRTRWEELLEALRRKWTKEKLLFPNGMKFSLRFPTSLKTECSLATTASTRDLYEIAVVFGEVMAPFYLYNLRPRVQVPLTGLVSELPFSTPSVLVVEVSDDAPDPLQPMKKPKNSICEPSTSSTADSPYRNYINLTTSDSESEPIYSPTPPPLSPITPQPQLACISLQSLLISHRNQVLSSDRDDTYRMKVRRKHVWEDALHHFKSGLPTTKHLRITFLGEPAVDAGGPLREFLQLLMSEIARNNTLFCGDETARVPNHNMVELSKKTYEYVGSMLAVSIVHGGPAPHFFAHGVADYIIYGIEHVNARVEDVPDVVVKEKLMKLLHTSNEMELHELLNTEEYDFRYECGVSQPVTSIEFSSREKIVGAIAMHYSVVRVKAELDQLVKGLNVLKIGDLVEANPQKMRELFVHFKPLPLTADAFFDLFPARLSPMGSNKREAEEAALMKWVNYTQATEDCGGSLEVTTPEGNIEHFEISLERIVSFATGMPEEPPSGFCPKPSILFQEHSKFPTANTCTNQIQLPLQDMTFEEFKYNMSYGILNTAGFGQI